MNWLKKLLGKKQVGGSAISPHRRELAKPVMVSAESTATYCAKMEAEAARTGNRRLAQQAQRIRARL